jgi:hypothetical protein
METISFTTFVDQLKERFALEVITENIGKNFQDLPFGDQYKGVVNEFLIDAFNRDVDVYVDYIDDLDIAIEEKIKLLLDFHYNVYGAVVRVVSTYFFYFEHGYTTYMFLDHIESRIKDLKRQKRFGLLDFVEYDNPSHETLDYLEGLFETLKGLPMKK